MKKKSLLDSFRRARRGTVCRELGWALFSAAQPKSARRGHRMHRARPPAPRFLLRRPPGPCFAFPLPLRGFSAPSPRRQPTSTKTITTALMSPQPTSWLSPQTQNQLSAAQVGRVGSRDLALLFGLCLASAGRANRHGDVAGRSRQKLDRRSRLFALVQTGSHGGSSGAGAWANPRDKRDSTGNW